MLYALQRQPARWSWISARQVGGVKQDASPNVRVQRTRGLALLGTLTSFSRLPLTRRPLGDANPGQEQR